MRLLHTADWHLGRSFHGAHLLDAQATVMDHLVAVVVEERPDAIVVSGDIFDRAYPPLDAVALYDESIARLAALKVPIVLTSGNHDSAVRLGVLGRVAESAGVHVRTRLDRIGEPIAVAPRAGAAGLLIYAIPYLDPPSCAGPLEAPEPSHAAVMGQALERIRQDRAQRPGIPAVVMAHGVIAGGRPVSEEGTRSVERTIDVGGVSAVPRELFAAADYVAMGHLHRPQTLGDRVRYSGAPLAFGFDEVGDRKSLSLVEIDGDGAPLITTIDTPQPRAIARITGPIDDLLSSSEYASAESAWVEAVVTDRTRPERPMDRLRQRFPHILKLEHQPAGATDDRSRESYTDRVRNRTATQIAEQFVKDVRRGVEADDAERTLLTEALEAVSRAEAVQ